MIEYGDLSKDAKQVLKLTMVYPHLSSNLKAVMDIGDSVSMNDTFNDTFFKTSLTELKNAGLIDLNSPEAANDKLLTPLAYQIIPKEVLTITLEEARRSLKKLMEESSFGPRRTMF
jgi:hypothetical protein